MNKISCNIIGDLLPLYVDGAVSEDTKKLVEEHLAECADCKKAAEEMGKELVLPVHEKGGGNQFFAENEENVAEKADSYRSDFCCSNGRSHFGKLYGADYPPVDHSL
jgi:predicted anti-sigma-YlaC factor YlaD